MRSKHILAFLLPAALIFAPACGQMNPRELTLSGTIEAESVHAGSRIGGRVSEVLVDEGVMVKEGDALFRLETDALDAERRRAEAVVNEAEAAYAVVAAGARAEDITRARQEAEALKKAWELAQAGPLPEDVAALENLAQSLETAYSNAQDAADRLAYLYQEGAASEREYVASQNVAQAANDQWQASVQQLEALKSRPRVEEVEAAQARYLAAINAVRALEAGPTAEQLASAQSHVATAREALNRIDVDLGEAVVEAPLAGLVSVFSLEPGDFVAPGQPSCEIADMDTLKLIVYIPENRLGFVHEGEELPVKVDSFPTETFKGVVKRVAAEAEFTPRNVQVVEERVSQVFAVEITLPNPEHRLRPGMAADVTVSLSQ